MDGPKARRVTARDRQTVLATHDSSDDGEFGVDILVHSALEMKDAGASQAQADDMEFLVVRGGCLWVFFMLWAAPHVT